MDRFRENVERAKSPQFALASVLGKGERGGLVFPPGNIEPHADGGLRMTNPPFDESILKSALLFVDRIDIPSSNMVTFGAGDIEKLPEVARSRVIFNNGPTAEQHNSQAWLTFKQLNERDPGRWSIWQHPDKTVIPAQELSPGLAFQIEFTKAFIVPHDTVPYDDVITFRERHRDALITLRHHIEELAIKLSKEGDKRAITHEVEKFDLALADYLKESRKSNLRKAVKSLTTEMDWSTAIREAMKGGSGGGFLSLAGSFSLTHAATLVGGGIFAAISIKSAAGLKKPDPSPFRYLTHVEQEYGS